MQKKLTWLWIIFGLGAKLQIVASLSITEAMVLILAPCIFIKEYPFMRRNGVMPFFVLSLFVIFGCIVASICNHTPMAYVVRGLAVTCLVSCAIVVSHWMLRTDPTGFKWYVVFAAISMILSTFVLKQQVEVAMLGEDTEDIMRGPLFWIKRLGGVIRTPIIGWYLRMPMAYIVTAPIFMAGFSLLSSTSGRGAMVQSAAFAAIAFIGGKKRRTMGRISQNFWKFCVFGLLFGSSMYFIYKQTASRGLLGEAARRKYELQTSGGQGGLGRLILGGRSDSFIGLLACIDKPIIGWGPWAEDKNGYADEFIMKYGTYEDVQTMLVRQDWMVRHGIMERMLAVHSHITEFWAWYGIFGLVFILYIMLVLLRYLKQDIAAIPQWFAWLACSAPSFFWGIVFSPFTSRFGTPLFVVACLMARAARKGTFKLPPEMVREIEKAERS